MKKIVIAEKPSVARDLARVLKCTNSNKNYFEGEDYIVTWALGHLLTLKMPEDINREWLEWKQETLPMLPKGIGIKPLPKTRGQLKAIESLTKRKDVSGCIIATDAGREGELVARWILEWVRFPKKVERLWISSQTDKAILEGFRKLKPARDYENLYAAALSRSIADWLIGLNVTRALTVKYKDNLSAGRVQTPTLGFVRGQEEKIEKFIPENYFEVNLNALGQTGKLNPTSRFKTRAEAENLLDRLKGKLGKVSVQSSKEKSIAAPHPFDLTELQQVANTMYGFSAKKTLNIVQSLYETHKAVTYPRTDSKYLPMDIQSTMLERVNAAGRNFELAKSISKKGAKVVRNDVFNDSKVTDHFALIPTEASINADRLSTDEWKIYKLITERFLGIFLENNVVSTQTIVVQFGDTSFQFKQKKTIHSGWKLGKEDEKSGFDWSGITSVQPNFSIEKGTITPPPFLNEGSLLKKMEEKGLGTPATRAEIIEKLISSELMVRSADGKSLKTTPKGRQLLELVNPSLRSPELTAAWEEKLELIRLGKFSPSKFKSAIESSAKELVGEIKNSKAVYKDFSLTSKKCPECGSALKERNTRDGKFLICTNCSYRRRSEPKLSNHRCPVCHKKMEIIEGAKGKYFRCKFDGTTEKMENNRKNKRMSKHEERNLLQKFNQETQDEESPLARALREAMEK
ncbi:MAG: DNA topoisomerase 3 [Streptococcaceae bacterium]|nr:DNA topoisomerase 3 [Streptococcaceae bacterium]